MILSSYVAIYLEIRLRSTTSLAPLFLYDGCSYLFFLAIVVELFIFDVTMESSFLVVEVLLPLIEIDLRCWFSEAL